ncbi:MULTISPECIES: ferredoxin [Antrihabitans]|jgi:ferredoxin|uniref:Ferredoxin n=2 Tax=Antrihabitans TaxID=2799491 RepID=A0A934NRW5_9NOCA|nr:ferredoxin [Antrihabitans stalagmiti]MBJ8340344.1 ferredoxin [Antrihabitans stalagmiti]
MEIKVDFDQCEANGICVGIAPDIFDLDDNDELQVASGPVPAGREEDVRDAIAQCPKVALREQP